MSYYQSVADLGRRLEAIEAQLKNRAGEGVQEEVMRELQLQREAISDTIMERISGQWAPKFRVERRKTTIAGSDWYSLPDLSAPNTTR